jgi:outer membrane protein OmpA-like peptidoglycan-associated protein
LTELQQARSAIDEAKRTGSLPPEKLAELEKRHLQETVGRTHFDFDKATLKPTAQQELASVLQELQENPTLRAELVGHTDATGSEAYNLGLSKRRVEAVRNFLVAKGIAANRFQLAWKGEGEPIAPNTTKEGQAQNRRVEITLRPLPVQ